MECAKSNQLNETVVISDDTDVFVLLLHYCKTGNLKNRVIMESPIKARTAIDIGLTVGKQASIVPEVGCSCPHWMRYCGMLLWYRKRDCFEGTESWMFFLITTWSSGRAIKIGNCASCEVHVSVLWTQLKQFNV